MPAGGRSPERGDRSAAGDRSVLYLASTSPRRRALLDAAGIPWRSAVPGDEPEGIGSPMERARVRARSKALGARIDGPAGLVLGADTVVALGDRELPKPGDRAEARAMLEALSGQDHEVFTALCIQPRPDGGFLEAVARAVVVCSPLDPAMIDAWLDTGEWRGKAGGYGIQDEGCGFMTLVEGQRDTVVGLPVDLLTDLLARARRGGV